MLSITPLADPPVSSVEPDLGFEVKPFDLTAIPDEPSELSELPKSAEFIMGPKQMASLAFVGILIIGLMSAIAYFAGRKNTAPPGQVTERVIERIVHTPAPATPAAAVAPSASVPVISSKPEETSKASSSAQTPTPPIKAIDPKLFAEITAPQFNQFYLQLASVEVGVAEVMVEGLRLRGMQAIAGVGINGKVARVLVGPFKTAADQQAAQKRIEEIGFHPFPRVFTPKDLEQQQILPAPQAAPPKSQPATPAKP